MLHSLLSRKYRILRALNWIFDLGIFPFQVNIFALIYEKCLHDAQKIHKIINCKGVSRTDFIYDEEEIYFLEINSQPGMTALSLLPEQANYKKIKFENIILQLINNARWVIMT